MTRYHVSSSGYGKSCLECRRRKKKCDGTRPACLRCQRNVRTCVYEEGYIRTSITDRLEGRVQELEESFKSLNASFKEKISSHKLLERLEGGSPLTVTTTRPSSPVLPFFPLSSLGTEDNSDISRTGVVLSAPSEIGYASAVPRAFIEAKLRQFQQTGVMSAELLDYLIRVFLPFRGHYKFFLDIPAFFDDVRQGGPTTDQALKNAIYLAACQIAGSSSLQPYFLFELRGHLDFSQPPNGRPDGVVWASVILGNYFLRSYRLSEARSVVLSAARYAFERELYPQRASGSGSASAAAPSAPRNVLKAFRSDPQRSRFERSSGLNPTQRQTDP
ncbi:uncharacterized protein EI90DRAFT_2643497 [Cantharellus anzutake]|uniref:uncharacterized protein n=1 Tax=Cantharellus anzutake TaxID=1750568 RepID=UPI0019037790|nr:uncharacterized protein EI90DRAFT_2643497 [Cantharellus anzutake]KAF8337381.1 hypothetical protein EI90DRAFT_2643497 [Cantharellus anzutake]